MHRMVVTVEHKSWHYDQQYCVVQKHSNTDKLISVGFIPKTDKLLTVQVPKPVSYQ